jgi:uncharacterized protein (TIGR02118 family)
MVLLSVLYPKTSESTFDLDYYLQTHIPRVKSRWSGMGLQRVDLVQGTAEVSGGVPPYELMAQLTFLTEDALNQALARHGQEILGDIPNFTNVQPLMQVGRPL